MYGLFAILSFSEWDNKCSIRVVKNKNIAFEKHPGMDPHAWLYLSMILTEEIMLNMVDESLEWLRKSRYIPKHPVEARYALNWQFALQHHRILKH